MTQVLNQCAAKQVSLDILMLLDETAETHTHWSVCFISIDANNDIIHRMSVFVHIILTLNICVCAVVCASCTSLTPFLFWSQTHLHTDTAEAWFDKVFVCDQGHSPSVAILLKWRHTRALAEAGSEQHCREQQPGQSEMSLLWDMGEWVCCYGNSRESSGSVPLNIFLSFLFCSF